MPNIYKVFHNLFILYDVTGVQADEFLPLYYLYRHSCWPSIWKFPRILVGSPGADHSVVVPYLRLYPFKMPPTSMSNIYKVSHNHYMLWMCIHVSPYHDTTVLIIKSISIKDSGCHLRSKPHHSAITEYRPIQDGSHINVNVNHINCDSQPLNAVDGVHVDESLPFY